MPYSTSKLCLVALAWSALQSCCANVWGQGLVYPGVGPVNQSMAGAAVAAPLDAAGAMHWNPAAISGLAGSELVVGFELYMPQSALTASAPANAFGPGSPAMEGTLGSHAGTRLLPTVAVVDHRQDSLWTFGLGVFPVGGFNVTYAASPSHPVTSRDGYGLGALASDMSVMQVAPTIAYQLNRRWAIGVAPVMSIVELGMTSALFSAPDDAAGDGRGSYPDATDSPVRYGLGIQGGVYFTTDRRWHFGASIKSKQWIEDFVFRTTDEIGDPRTVGLRVEYPMIVSVGTAYSGLSRWLFAADVRYLNFSATDFLGDDAMFRGDGSLVGLGWRDSMSSSVACQYQWSDSVSLRVGHGYGQSPVSPTDVSANLHTGDFWNHRITMGCTVHLAANVSLNVAYVRTFDKSTIGRFLTADGPIAGGSVAVAQRANAISTGISAQF